MRKRKTTYALLGPLPHAIVYVGAPLAVSRLGRHHGWENGRPGAANVLGLVPLAAGAAMLAWAIVSHYQTAPDEAKVTVVPTYLVKGGAYAVTRNPMYVSGAAMHAGWAVFLGSVPVAATFPLDDCEAAYERFAAGAKLGKVVLRAGRGASPAAGR